MLVTATHVHSTTGCDWAKREVDPNRNVKAAKPKLASSRRIALWKDWRSRLAGYELIESPYWLQNRASNGLVKQIANCGNCPGRRGNLIIPFRWWPSRVLPGRGEGSRSAADYAATTFIARLWAARLRWFSSRSFLRRRRFFGVASTYSSGPIYSRARSRDIFSGGLSWMPLPSP